MHATLLSFCALLLWLCFSKTSAQDPVKIAGGQAATIYSESPKLKIPIENIGNDVQSENIAITLGYGTVTLEPPQHYFSVQRSTDGTPGVILKLAKDRKWVDFVPGGSLSSPVTLTLTSISIEGTVVLSGAFAVARVLRTPVVNPVADGTAAIFKTGTPSLVIHGSGFKGAKDVKLFFDPPMMRDIDYEISGDQFDIGLIHDDTIVMRLKQGRSWASDKTDKKLRLVAIDMGGGKVQCGDDTPFDDDDSHGRKGVVVATIKADEAGHKVAVTPGQALTQLLYSSESPLTIKGSDFRDDDNGGTKMKFANGLAPNFNYSVVATTTKKVVLQLKDGRTWRSNPMTLPAPLTLMQMDAGSGFVDVGPVNTNKGMDVATIFQKPTVRGNMNPATGEAIDAVKLYRTHSHELWIYGGGFIPLVKAEFGVNQFKFKPPLASTDYEVSCDDRGKVVVSLKTGKAWASGDYVGPLRVTHVKTKGTAVNDNDWVTVGDGDKGVTVAEIINDVTAEDTGGFTLIPNTQKVYASVRGDKLDVFGTGFVTDMRLEFFSSDFEDANAETIRQDVDFKLTFVSENKLVLSLLPGKKWMEDGKHGSLFVKSIIVPAKKEDKAEKSYELAGGEGIRIGVVYEDPLITTATERDTLHTTQSKVAYIYGSGFTSRTEMSVTLGPTSTSAYHIVAASDDQFKVQLNPGKSWLPLQFNDAKGKIPLYALEIDTGAGPYHFAGSGVLIGHIVPDREGVVCDDSCEWAFDGVCDESYGGGWQGDSNFYYGYYDWDDYDWENGYMYYYSYTDVDDFWGQNVDDDYLSTAYSYQHPPSAYGSNPYADDWATGACLRGTDCTDCGGVDQYIDWNTMAPNADDDYIDVACSNTCKYARDGVCDDPRNEDYCAMGTDCQDCGPVGASNFSTYSDDMWWDDDDYWLWDDVYFMSQADGLDANRHRLINDEEATEVSTFLTVLEGVVYAVGGAFLFIGGYVGYKVATGNSATVYQALSMELTPDELEMVPTQRMAITPDTLRT